MIWGTRLSRSADQNPIEGDAGFCEVVSSSAVPAESALPACGGILAAPHKESAVELLTLQVRKLRPGEEMSKLVITRRVKKL